MSFSEGGAVFKRKPKEAMDQTPHLHETRKNKKRDHGRGDRVKAKRRALVSFWELPEYMKDNEFILNYYRANWPLKEALFSIFRWHNETLNVWTCVKA
jgi:adiponectin receptor